MDDKSAESFLNFVQAKTIQAADDTESVAPVGLSKTVQSAGARLENNGQVWLYFGLPGLECGFKNRMQQMLLLRLIQPGR